MLSMETSLFLYLFARLSFPPSIARVVWGKVLHFVVRSVLSHPAGYGIILANLIQVRKEKRREVKGGMNVCLSSF